MIKQIGALVTSKTCKVTISKVTGKMHMQCRFYSKNLEHDINGWGGQVALGWMCAYNVKVWI